MRLPIAVIRLLTVIYVSFVLIPFFIGWVRIQYAAPLVVLYAWGMYNYYRSLDFSYREFWSKKALLFSALFIFIWVALSGAGGVGYQVSDLSKSNTLIKELTLHTWPLEYAVDGEKMYLSHYLGYYLPGPFLLSWLGYKYVQLFLFFYTLIGISLGVFWLARFAQKDNSLFAGFLILFGGISTFSFLFKFGGEAIAEFVHRVSTHGYVFWLNSWDVIPLNYMAISDMLYWTPQHIIPTFIGIGFLLNDSFIDRDISYTPFAISLLAIWSPLVLVGLFPFFAYVLFHGRFKGIWNITNLLISPAIFGVVAIFLLAIESETLVKHFIFTDLSGRGLTYLDQIGTYFYFVFFEVLIWAIPIFFVLRGTLNLEYKTLLGFTVLLLLLIPFYRFGLWNDWCNRVSMPAIVVLALFAFKGILQSKGLMRFVMLALLTLGSSAAVIGMVGSVKMAGNKVGFFPPELHEVQTLPEICVGYPITQFVAPSHSFFYTHLGKRKD